MLWLDAKISYTSQHDLKLSITYMDEWWNLMHYMLLIELKIMVDKYKIDEEMYRGKLIFYKDVYIGFVYHMFIDNPRQLV
jgi:hypothetical protein